MNTKGVFNVQKRIAAVGAALLTSILWASSAQSAIIIYAWDSGSDIDVAWSGSLNLTGATSAGTSGDIAVGINGNTGQMNLMRGGSLNTGYNVVFSRPAGYTGDTGRNNFLASNTGGAFLSFTDHVQSQDTAIYINGNSLFINNDPTKSIYGGTTYVNDTEISGSGTLAGTSISTLNWFSGNYRWTLSNNDYVEFRIGEQAPADEPNNNNAVPEPPVLALVGTGLLGLLGRQRLRA